MDLVLIFGSVIVMVTVLGGMTLSGWRYWVRTRNKLSSDELTSALQDAIHDEVDRALAARDGELAELHERIDFAERLLSRPGPGVGDKAEPK